MTSSDDRSALEAHYAPGVEEQRLATLARFEFLRTREILSRHLPLPPAVIADIGGGPGTYALPLAADGYEVHLLDLMAVHVERARERSDAQDEQFALRSARVGDARNLPWPEQSMDVCLFFGPMYHLTEQDQRHRALTEAHRVLRPGGVLLATAISRFASLYAGLVRGLLHDPGFRPIVERDLRDGQHRNPTRQPSWFTSAYYHLPEEFAVEITVAGFSLDEVLAVDGPAGCVSDLGAWLQHDEGRETLLDIVRAVEHEPSLLGASPQLMAIARKPVTGRSRRSGP